MKTGAISIYGSNFGAQEYRIILNELLSNGWSVNKDGSIVYVIDDSYMPLDIPFSEDNLNLIETKIFENIKNNTNASLDLIHTSGAIVALHFADNEQISIAIPEEVICIKNTNIPDFSWYLENVKGVFPYINFYRLTCVFD